MGTNFFLLIKIFADWGWIGEWSKTSSCEYESESLHEARLAADVERVIVARENKIESLRYKWEFK